MSKTNPKWEFVELIALSFLQWMAFALYLVPLALVLRAHGFAGIQPFAFATTAIGAFVSPLFFGALADRQLGATRVLRGLYLAAAVMMSLAALAIHQGWNPWLTLAVIQGFALCATPTVSLSTTIAMARLRDPKRQFGPVRAVGTVGWMVGCWMISAFNADASTRALYMGAGLWGMLAVFSWVLPQVAPPATATHLNIRERLGLDALSLLKMPDHRVVFLTATLFTMPLAAFYPYTPPHLKDLGLERTSAWMSLGQTTEIIAMFTLGALLVRWRLKWILGAALACGIVRYICCAQNERVWLLTGVALHGVTYTLFFTTAQIYVNERVDPAWRARGQALLSLLLAGVGHLIGYLGCGLWFNVNTDSSGTDWSLYWGGLAGVITLIFIYFLAAYRGRGIVPAVSQPVPATKPLTPDPG